MRSGIGLALLIAAVIAAPASARVPRPLETIDLPPSRETGLDMILIDAEAMPAEPEFARDVPRVEDEGWSGAPIDLLKPIHHLYTDFRRQLARYQLAWGALPQVRVPTGGPVIARGSADPRVQILRERLGLAREGSFDAAAEARVAAYQRAHGLPDDGKAGAETLASLNLGAGYYERLILLNMERARRLPPSDTAGRYVLVDAAAARLWMYENGRPVDSMKVIVGTPESATPMMAALMRFASVNPYWNIPPDLVRKTIAPRVLADGISYLKEKRYEALGGWDDDAPVLDPATVDWKAVADGRKELRVRQLPGAGNFMGEIKFMMPNEYGIYLHDTPVKALFDEDERWLSNGCVRVEDARRLARWLFGAMPKAGSPDREEDVGLDNPVPVYITYLTIGAGGGSSGLSFRKDRYGRDAPLLARFGGEGERMSDFEPGATISAGPLASGQAGATKLTETGPTETRPAAVTVSQPATKAAKPAANTGKAAAKPAASASGNSASAAAGAVAKPSPTRTAAR